MMCCWQETQAAGAADTLQLQINVSAEEVAQGQFVSQQARSCRGRERNV